MKDLNQDGLIPGQPVDFATIQRVNNQRKQPTPELKEAPKRGRPSSK
jgi:hypothetical protein